jgi:hypothetical protein
MSCWALGGENDGLVTASQARAIGIVGSVLARLAQRGKLERVARAVFIESLTIPPTGYRNTVKLFPGRVRVTSQKTWLCRTRRLWRCMGFRT